LRLVLEAMVRDEGRRIDEIELLTGSEKEQVLVKWNGTEREYGAIQVVHELFEEQARRRPDSVALVYEEQAVSYRELNGWANRLAHYLREMGVGVEIRVAVCVERSVEMVVGLLGVLKAGGAYIPLDVNYPAERLGRMIEDSRAAIVLTQNRLKGRMPASWAQVV